MNPVPVGKKITINQLWSKSEVAIAVQSNNQPWLTREDMGRLGERGEMAGGEEHNEANSIERRRCGNTTMMMTKAHPKI
jgi:hypothetical protein